MELTVPISHIPTGGLPPAGGGRRPRRKRRNNSPLMSMGGAGVYTRIGELPRLSAELYDALVDEPFVHSIRANRIRAKVTHNGVEYTLVPSLRILLKSIPRGLANELDFDDRQLAEAVGKITTVFVHPYFSDRAEGHWELIFDHVRGFREAKGARVWLPNELHVRERLNEIFG